MRILLIEDDPLIGDGLAVGLNRMGHGVDWFTDGQLGEEALCTAPYDAVVLDLGLPGVDGMEILAHWREREESVPVLVLTARDALEARLAGLRGGADDYLCKPFALAEVEARLQALLRRTHGRFEPLQRFGEIEYNPANRTVTRNGVYVALSPRELAVLELFLNHRGQVLSKSTIQEKLYTWSEDVSSNTVEVFVHHLRRKLGNDLIRTVHGLGYALDEAAEKRAGA